MGEVTLEVVLTDQLETAGVLEHMTSGLDQTPSRDTFAAFVDPFVLGAFGSVDSFAEVRIVIMEKQQGFDNMEPVQ